MTAHQHILVAAAAAVTKGGTELSLAQFDKSPTREDPNQYHGLPFPCAPTSCTACPPQTVLIVAVAAAVALGIGGACTSGACTFQTVCTGKVTGRLLMVLNALPERSSTFGMKCSVVVTLDHGAVWCRVSKVVVGLV